MDAISQYQNWQKENIWKTLLLKRTSSGLGSCAYYLYHILSSLAPSQWDNDGHDFK